MHGPRSTAPAAPRLRYLKLHELAVSEPGQAPLPVSARRGGGRAASWRRAPAPAGPSRTLPSVLHLAGGVDPPPGVLGLGLSRSLCPATQVPGPSSVNCLHITGSLALEVPEGRLPGCLAQLPPQLLELIVVADRSMEQLAEALQGHPRLQSLLVTSQPEQGGDDDDQQQQQQQQQPQQQQPQRRAWPRQLLRRLPAMQDLTLYDSQLDPLQLLHDLAGCLALASLHIEGPEEQAPLLVADPGPLAALAAGAAAAGLLKLQVCPSTCALTPAAVAALLQGGLPLLREAELAVVVPEELCSEELVERRLPGLLALAGASVAVQCARCSELKRRVGAGLMVAFVALAVCGWAAAAAGGRVRLAGKRPRARACMGRASLRAARVHSGTGRDFRDLLAWPGGWLCPLGPGVKIGVWAGHTGPIQAHANFAASTRCHSLLVKHCRMVAC
jgi:hypothetical protein